MYDGTSALANTISLPGAGRTSLAESVGSSLTGTHRFTLLGNLNELPIVIIPGLPRTRTKSWWTGIALGSIFVITLVMGDFFVVKIMSGGQSASVVMGVFEDVNLLFYPPAAASSVVLLIIVTAIVSGILRIVDVRKELTA